MIKYENNYAEAIAAVGRDWLNAVIVKDVQSLLKVSEAARRLKISRLTTVPLSEVGQIPATEKPNFPGVMFYVTDVVECDPVFESLVNFVFGDSVIVDSPNDWFSAPSRRSPPSHTARASASR